MSASATTQDSGPPVRDIAVPLDYSLEELFDAAVLGEAYPDDPPPVGQYDTAIDDPKFIASEVADEFLGPGEIVFGIEINEETKAYPRRILVWHEVVNDVVGGTAISVTYCPLTGSTLTFERGETTFGMSGKLVNSNLILYDRVTESWWPQLLGAAIAGPLAGMSLREVETAWTTWSRWSRRYPETAVLSEETGYVRNYNDDPYGSYNPPAGYYAGGPPARTLTHNDDRHPHKAVFLGARTGDGAIAFDRERLRDRGLLTGEVDGRRYIAVYDANLDAGYVYAAEEPVEVDGAGTALVGGRIHPVGALPLPRVNAFYVMWFAWAAFFPSTSLADG